MKSPRKWLVVLGIVAALVLGVTCWQLWLAWHARPIAAAFTRVSGATRVDTALDASRFWVKRPWRVVITPASASEGLMLGAARCAMAQNAPLLFGSRYPKRQRLVEATIDAWRDETANGAPRLRLIRVRHQRDVTSCLPDPARTDVPGLTTLPDPLFPDLRKFPRVSAHDTPRLQPGDTLAPVVVFAAAKAPGELPDVAVGLALAAHMTHMTKVPRQVSLVVVPRYLEAYPRLESLLRNQTALVKEGIVLGGPSVVPDDTRALLRQLLTATDRAGFVALLQANLGSVVALLVALLTLLGLGAVTVAALGISNQVVQLNEVIRASFVGSLPDQDRVPGGKRAPGYKRPPTKKRDPRNSVITRTERRIRMALRGRKPPGLTTLPAEDLLSTLNKLGRKGEKVTIWLHSGDAVTGTFDQEFFPDGDTAQPRTATVLRLNNATLETKTAPPANAPFVLVPGDAIELIAVRGFDSTPGN